MTVAGGYDRLVGRPFSSIGVLPALDLTPAPVAG